MVEKTVGIVDQEYPNNVAPDKLIGRAKRLTDDLMKQVQTGVMSQVDMNQAIDDMYEADRQYAAALSAHLGLSFAPRVDGEGAFYAGLETTDGWVLVNVFPPIPLWNGTFLHEGLKLSQTDWVLTISGDPVSQASEIIDLVLQQGHTLELDEVPDPSGIYGGMLNDANGQLVQTLKLQPPVDLWEGAEVDPNFTPDQTHWKIYIGPTEIGRLAALEPDSVATLIAARSAGQITHKPETLPEKRFSLNLSKHPDAYGFIYGQLTSADGTEEYRVDILPPIKATPDGIKWSGDLYLDGYKPDQTAFILFLNGEEVGRVEALDPAQIAQLVAEKNE